MVGPHLHETDEGMAKPFLHPFRVRNFQLRSEPVFGGPEDQGPGPKGPGGTKSFPPTMTSSSSFEMVDFTC